MIIVPLISESKVEGCETIYECCGQDLNSEGCQKVCKKCGVEWGKSANECYQKSHDLERVEVDLWRMKRNKISQQLLEGM